MMLSATYYFKKYVADKEDPGLCQQLTLGLGVGHQNDGANSGCNLALILS